MYPSSKFHPSPILPNELSMLQNVLDKALEDRKLSADSSEADELARSIIHLYQSGVRRAADLHEMIKAI